MRGLTFISSTAVDKLEVETVLAAMHCFRGCMVVAPTLRSSLSGTFLQTLPGLVTPLKGHSLSPRSAPYERFGYW